MFMQFLSNLIKWFAQVLINLGLLKKRTRLPLPVEFENAKRMEQWKIGYSRDGRFFVMGWVDGKWTTSDYIKDIAQGMVTDVHNKTYIFGERDGGEWEYSLKVCYPSGWEWFNNCGVL